MTQPLRLGVLAWAVARIGTIEDYAAHLDRLVAQGAADADLLLMPEYACMEVASALVDAPDPGAELEAVCAHSDALLEIMRGAAMRHGVWLMPGTLPRPEAQGVRNRAPLIAPDGRIMFQDKHVMTRFENESWGVRAGNPPGVFETPWGLIGAAVCYDSEFPMLTRRQIEAGAWLILVPTCTDSCTALTVCGFQHRPARWKTSVLWRWPLRWAMLHGWPRWMKTMGARVCMAPLTVVFRRMVLWAKASWIRVGGCLLPSTPKRWTPCVKTARCVTAAIGLHRCLLPHLAGGSLNLLR